MLSLHSIKDETLAEVVQIYFGFNLAVIGFALKREGKDPAGFAVKRRRIIKTVDLRIELEVRRM